MKALPKWAAYWADGNRSLPEIAALLRVELRRDVPAAQALQQFQALAELQYVELVPAEELITKARLIHDLRALGVRPGMHVMVHSSLSKIGHVAAGAASVVDALLAAIGRRGTLLAPSFNHAKAKVFNPLATPTNDGAVADAMWRRPEAVRSLHPSHAVCAIGPQAAAWCAGHLENGVWGAHSPIGRLIEAGGYILSLGVEHRTTTAYHIAETSLRCGCLDQFANRYRIVGEDGRVREVRGLAWRAASCPVPIRKIDETLNRRKLQTHGMVGKAHATLVKAVHVWQARREHLKGVCPTCAVKPGPRVTSDE
jgi:aminoglycoside 3-N-acetyltransferase